MHPRLKKIIFNKLYEDLKHAEIIHFQDSIWFIDREKKYWYLEYEKNGTLWWRHDFFTNFFLLFSIGRLEYQEIIAEWMKEVLNLKVDTILIPPSICTPQMKEVLNLKVDTMHIFSLVLYFPMKEVLNLKVDTIESGEFVSGYMIEEILNFNLDTNIKFVSTSMRPLMGDALNFKVDITPEAHVPIRYMVEEVLNSTL